MSCHQYSVLRLSKEGEAYFHDPLGSSGKNWRMIGVVVVCCSLIVVLIQGHGYRNELYQSGVGLHMMAAGEGAFDGCW